jgi:hypothetical protein
MPLSRTSRLALLTTLGSIAAAASLTSSAMAGTPRHASPAGSGTACSPAAPCAITQAVAGAASGDEIVVHPGDYALTATLDDPVPITVHGIPGEPRPRLIFSGKQNGVRADEGSTLRWLEIDQGYTAIGLFLYDGLGDGLVIRSQGDGAEVQVDSTLRDSLVTSALKDGRAVHTATNGGTNTAHYRNVTAIATGPGGVGIQALALGAAGRATVHATNVIAVGDPGGAGVRARTDSTGAQATVVLSHSSSAVESRMGTGAVVSDGGGNVHGAPLFVNAAAGDFHQAPGSPTIGAGLDDPLNGPLDVDGDVRASGTTDIGADEFLVPPPPAPAPLPAPDVVAPAPPPAAAPPFAGVRLISTRLVAAHGYVTLTLRCPAGTPGGCSGATTLVARRRPVVLGAASFAVAPGGRARVKVHVAPRGRRLLRRSRRLPARVTSSARSGSGQAATTVAAVTIRRRH